MTEQREFYTPKRPQTAEEWYQAEHAIGTPDAKPWAHDEIKRLSSELHHLQDARSVLFQELTRVETQIGNHYIRIAELTRPTLEQAMELDRTRLLAKPTPVQRISEPRKPLRPYAIPE